jgi:hypothetical protein
MAGRLDPRTASAAAVLRSKTGARLISKEPALFFLSARWSGW